MGPVTLSAEESRHAVVSLRIKPGQEVVVFDGTGRQADARVLQTSKTAMTVDVGLITASPPELSKELTLAVAMPRTHRQGYLIEKCTELGVTAVWPVLAERAVAKPRKDALQRWTRRAIEAAKQSHRASVPTIAHPRPLAEILATGSQFDAVALAHREPPTMALGEFMDDHSQARSILVLVGPEGGWSPAEIRASADSNATRVTLAANVLRTETTAVAVCAVVASWCCRPCADKTAL